MKNYINNNNTEIKFESGTLEVIVNDIKLYYLQDKDMYVLSKVDNTKMNVNEIVNLNNDDSATLIEVAKQMIDYLTNALALERSFNSVNYRYNKDKTLIIIKPIYEKNKVLKKEVN